MRKRSACEGVKQAGMAWKCNLLCALPPAGRLRGGGHAVLARDDLVQGGVLVDAAEQPRPASAG